MSLQAQMALVELGRGVHRWKTPLRQTADGGGE
jgi:hypothetical protein